MFRCASHLYMLCKFALKAYNDHHLYDVSSIESHFRQHHYSSIQYIFAPQSRPLTGQMRGLLVDYAIVPGVLLSLIFPLWGLTLFVTPSFPHTSALLSFPLPSLLHNTTDISTLSALSPHILRAMQEQSLLYSKNGNRLGGGGNFRGDSTSKDGWANDDIVSLSEAILGKIFSTMKQKSAADLSILLDKNLHGKSDLQEEQLKLIPQPNIRLDPSFPMSEGIFTTTDRLTWTVPGLFETNYVSEPYTVSFYSLLCYFCVSQLIVHQLPRLVILLLIHSHQFFPRGIPIILPFHRNISGHYAPLIILPTSPLHLSIVGGRSHSFLPITRS